VDDIVIIVTSREKIIDIYKKMQENPGKIGLEVNERKTKYMIMSTSDSRRKPEDLKVEGKSFMGVCSFKYLGNMTTEMIIVLKKRYKLETGPSLQILEYLQAR
jgi:hypothetical protein